MLVTATMTACAEIIRIAPEAVFVAQEFAGRRAVQPIASAMIMMLVPLTNAKTQTLAVPSAGIFRFRIVRNALVALVVEQATLPVHTTRFALMVAVPIARETRFRRVVPARTTASAMGNAVLTAVVGPVPLVRFRRSPPFLRMRTVFARCKYPLKMVTIQTSSIIRIRQDSSIFIYHQNII